MENLIYSLRAEWMFQRKKKRSGKICNNATLIAYELKTFSWQPFSLSVNKKTCTEIEKNTKEHMVSKKLVMFLVSAIYRYGPVDDGVDDGVNLDGGFWYELPRCTVQRHCPLLSSQTVSEHKRQKKRYTSNSGSPEHSV